MVRSSCGMNCEKRRKGGGFFFKFPLKETNGERVDACNPEEKPHSNQLFCHMGKTLRKLITRARFMRLEKVNNWFNVSLCFTENSGKPFFDLIFWVRCQVLFLVHMMSSANDALKKWKKLSFLMHFYSPVAYKNLRSTHELKIHLLFNFHHSVKPDSSLATSSEAFESPVRPWRGFRWNASICIWYGVINDRTRFRNGTEIHLTIGLCHDLKLARNASADHGLFRFKWQSSSSTVKKKLRQTMNTKAWNLPPNLPNGTYSNDERCNCFPNIELK